MGTGFKGNSPTYRTIGENISDVSKNYNFSKGYFGENSPHGKEPTRNISSDDALKTAKDFYHKASAGGEETQMNNGKGVTAKFPDGSRVSFRETSSSDGSPAVEVTITHPGTAKTQKIHFVKE